jgi:hypothetical protein
MQKGEFPPSGNDVMNQQQESVGRERGAFAQIAQRKMKGFTKL